MARRQEIHSLYDLTATHFEMRLFVRPEATTEGALLVDLGERFLSTLVLPGCRVSQMWTKRPVEDAKLNIGDFSDRRWKTSVKKLRAGEYNVLDFKVENPTWPDHHAWFGAHVNPAAGGQYSVPIVGDVHITCSLSYLRTLAESAEGIEALIQLGIVAWNGMRGGAAYGFGNVAMAEKIVAFNPFGPQDPNYIPPWERLGRGQPDMRPHAIPVAYVGLNVDLNLNDMYCGGRGIKGAFWANYLGAPYVGMVGGEPRLRANLPGVRVDSLDGGGLLIITTASPLPEDSGDTRERFLQVHRVLQPAFLSRSAVAEGKRALLGYFYRERPSIMP